MGEVEAEAVGAVMDRKGRGEEAGVEEEEEVVVGKVSVIRRGRSVPYREQVSNKGKWDGRR